MIERFINSERPYGEPEYSKRSKEIARLKALLHDQLEQTGKDWLEQLSDAHIRQESAVLRDAFSNGFYTAIEMVLEFEQWKSGNQ